MKQTKKNINEYTDRELLEKSVVFMKEIADNTRFVKIYLIIMLIISFFVALKALT